VPPQPLVVDAARVDARGLSTVLRFAGAEHELSYAASRPVSPAVGDVLARLALGLDPLRHLWSGLVADRFGS